jgi:phage protein D
MAGTVAIIEPGLTATRVIGYSAAALLLRSRVEQTYESKAAGAIVRDLAQQAGVDVATAQEGISFPAYVVDGARSVYHHMRDLAELCGFDLYIDAEGSLVFEKFTGGKAVHVMEFAKHILGLEGLRTPPVAGLVEAWGESPTGSQGDDAWAWLTADFRGSRGTAGSGARLLLERPVLRTSAASATAAQAALTDIKRRTLRGLLRTVGRPQVKLGDAIQLRAMPDDSLNKSFQVRSVVHRIAKASGFTTTIGFRAIET